MDYTAKVKQINVIYKWCWFDDTCVLKIKCTKKYIYLSLK